MTLDCQLAKGNHIQKRTQPMKDLPLGRNEILLLAVPSEAFAKKQIAVNFDSNHDGIAGIQLSLVSQLTFEAQPGRLLRTAELIAVEERKSQPGDGLPISNPTRSQETSGLPSFPGLRAEKLNFCPSITFVPLRRPFKKSSNFSFAFSC